MSQDKELELLLEKVLDLYIQKHGLSYKVIDQLASALRRTRTELYRKYHYQQHPRGEKECRTLPPKPE